MRSINNTSFLPRIKYGVNSSRNPERTKDWIPHPSIKDFEGRQARNDRSGNPVAKLQGINILNTADEVAVKIQKLFFVFLRRVQDLQANTTSKLYAGGLTGPYYHAV